MFEYIKFTLKLIQSKKHRGVLNNFVLHYLEEKLGKYTHKFKGVTNS